MRSRLRQDLFAQFETRGHLARMQSGDLPPAVRRFIGQYLTSIEQLEVLQLLAASPAVEWTAGTVYKSVLTNPASIEQCLEHFTGAGFVKKSQSVPASYRWIAPAEISAVVADLCRLYVEMPVRIIGAIYQPGTVVQEFADAFKLKRPP